MNATVARLARALVARFGVASRRRRRERAAIASAPFPRFWAEWLEMRSNHYRRLPTEYQKRFRDQTQIFLAEKRLTGVEMEVDEEVRLLVAASAVSLSVGWPDYTWDHVAEVLLYPASFDREYNFGRPHLAGQADAWGVVILSVPALIRSFDEASDGYHVGFHEFAHLLDFGRPKASVPAGLDDQTIGRWSAIVRAEEERLLGGESVMRPYALSSPAEFFPSAVEAFLQMPVATAERHAELYAFLTSYFGQDPAAWERGA